MHVPRGLLPGHDPFGNQRLPDLTYGPGPATRGRRLPGLRTGPGYRRRGLPDGTMARSHPSAYLGRMHGRWAARVGGGGMGADAAEHVPPGRGSRPGTGGGNPGGMATPG